MIATLREDERDYWDWATFLAGHHLVGTNPFFQGPLYPYLLALLRPLTGADVHATLVVQAAWGALAVGLITDAARRLVGALPALAIGFLISANTMWVFLDGRILAESPLLVLECLLIWIWCRQRAEGFGAGANTFAGLLIGLMAQCRASQMVLLVPHLVLLHRQRALRPQPWSRGAAITLATFALTALPSTLWNLSRAHAFIPFTYNGGFNLYVGNNPRADGGFVWPEGTDRLGSVRAASPDGSVAMDGREFLLKSRGLDLGPAESSRYWTREALAFASAHPWRTLQLGLTKIMLMVSRREVPQIEHLSTFDRLAGPIGLPGVGSFLLIAALGLVGAAFAARWGPTGEAIRLQLVLAILAVVPFFVTDRYRIHLLPPIAILASMALARFGAIRRWREARAPALAGAVALGVVCLPLADIDREYEEWIATGDLGLRWLEVGRTSEAEATFERAIRMESDATAKAGTDPAFRRMRAEMRFNHAASLRALGRDDEAIAELVVAASLEPGNAHYVRTLADAYRARGRPQAADSVLAQVPGLVAGDAELAVSEGYRAAREGRFRDASAAFERAVEQDARLYGAWGALIRAQVLGGDVTGAQRTLARAVAAGMPPVPAAVYEGLVSASRGDRAGAARALARVGTAELDPTLRSVAEWTRQQIAGAAPH